MERPTGVANREDLEQSSRDNSFPLPTLFFMVLARLCRIISLDLCLKRNQEPNSQTLLTRERREGIITNIYGQKIFLQGMIKNVLCGFVRLDLIKDLVSQPLVETLLPFSLPKEIINVHILPCVVGIECLLEDVETLIGYLPNHFIDLDGLNEEMLPAILPIIVRNWHKFTITSRKIVYDIVRFAEPANLKLFEKSSATRQLYFQCVGRLLSMFDVPDVWKEVFDCRLRDLVREYSELQQILDQHFPITLQRSETEEHTKNGVLYLPN